MLKNIDIKTITFYKFAHTIGAVEQTALENIKIDTLLLDSFLFLIKKRVVTKKEEKNILVFKDRYNNYLEYCLENNLIKKDTFIKVDRMYLMCVPDMSHIQIPDVTDKLKELNFDVDNIAKVFAQLKT